MREYERAIERNEDLKVASFVLEELRTIIRGSNDAVRPRVEDPTRLVFRFIEPFLVEGVGPIRPGQIRRASLLPVWLWLEREGAHDLVRGFETELLSASGGSPADTDRVVRKFQQAVGEFILQAIRPASGVRGISKINPPHVLEDLPVIGTVLKSRDALDSFAIKIPSFIRTFGEPQVASINAALSSPAVVPVLAFALTIVKKRLSASWQVIRVAIRAAASDDETRVAATPYGISVSMVIHDLAQVTASLRGDIKRGKFDNVAEHLRIVHDGIRGLRTELDIRNDSVWGRQLAAIRVEVSGALQSEIDSVPGRVRRLLRQRSDKDIQNGPQFDEGEVAEVVDLIDFVAVCRTFASELAINEVTMRTYSDLQQYVEKSTEILVQSLRNSEGKVRAFRRTQVDAAIRFCEVLFGQDYASLMSRAADNAMVVVERKPSRAG